MRGAANCLPGRGGVKDRRGIVALEYALLAGLIGMTIFAAATHFSGAESSLYGAISNAVTLITAPATGRGA